MSKRFLIFALLTLAIGSAIVVYTRSQYFWNAYKAKPVTDKQIVEFAAKLGLTNSPVQSISNVPMQSVLAPLDLSQPVRLAVGGLGLADSDQNQQLGEPSPPPPPCVTGSNGKSKLHCRAFSCITVGKEKK
jgi:hypothetical protein